MGTKPVLTGPGRTAETGRDGRPRLAPRCLRPAGGHAAHRRGAARRPAAGSTSPGLDTHIRQLCAGSAAPATGGGRPRCAPPLLRAAASGGQPARRTRHGHRPSGAPRPQSTEIARALSCCGHSWSATARRAAEARQAPLAVEEIAGARPAPTAVPRALPGPRALAADRRRAGRSARLASARAGAGEPAVRRAFAWAALATRCYSRCGAARAQSVAIDLGAAGAAGATSRIVQLTALITVLSLAPSLLVMMTAFTRIVIVLSLLRGALGTQGAPPNTVLIGLALFLTFFVMQPVTGTGLDRRAAADDARPGRRPGRAAPGGRTVPQVHGGECAAGGPASVSRDRAAGRTGAGRGRPVARADSRVRASANCVARSRWASCSTLPFLVIDMVVAAC